MTPRPPHCCRPALLGMLLAAIGTPTLAEDPPAGDVPLSVIDWLGEQQPENPDAEQAALTEEPPVTTSGEVPKISVAPLGEGSPRAIGLVPSNLTGLPTDIWAGSDVDDVAARLKKLPELHLPAAQSLLYTILLADARAPRSYDTSRGDDLTLARVEKLKSLGALDPATSLIELAGVTTSVAHFELWMRLSLLNGTEDRACAVLARNPHLTTDLGLRILCAARAGRWEDAALTFGSASALELMPDEKLDLLDRFLNPDLFEGEDPLPAPRHMDELSFRLFEAIGERKATGALPLQFAVADLRDLAGWKAQLEAAERLTRAGALPDNHLLGLYTDRKPAASGGVWDRVAAVQRFETALETGSSDAVGKTLPPAWGAVKEAQLETAFAGLFAERLATFDLDGTAARLALEVGLLSPQYEATAAAAPDDPETALLRAVALGEVSTTRPQDPVAAAIFDAFADPQPDPDLVALARQDRLGDSILRLLVLLEEGVQGDTGALRKALATLRALGMEDTARRAALQTLLLER